MLKSFLTLLPLVVTTAFTSFCQKEVDEQVHERLLAKNIRLLQTHGISTDPDGIIEYLRKLRPNENLKKEIDDLIGQLASEKFAQRELAGAKLKTLGVQTKPQLFIAAQSSDKEIAWRSKKILNWLGSSHEGQLRRSLLEAALKILRQRPSSQAVPILLQTLDELEDSHLLDIATEAIWASVDDSHVPLLRHAMKNGNRNIQAIAIVALAVADSKRSIPIITPYLNSEMPKLKLAAARALTDQQTEASIASPDRFIGQSR